MSRKELYRRTKGCVFLGIADFVVWIILTLATAAIGIMENPAQIQIILAFLLLSDLVASVVLFLAYWKYWLDLIQKATLVFSEEVVSGGPIIGSPIETRSNWRLTEKGTDTMRQFLIYLPEMEKQYHKTTKTTLIQDICYGPVSFLYLKRSKYIVEIKSLSAPEQNKLSKHAQKKKRRRVNAHVR